VVGDLSGGDGITGSRVGDTGSSRGITVYFLIGCPICATADLPCGWPVKTPVTKAFRLSRAESSELDGEDRA